MGTDIIKLVRACRSPFNDHTLVQQAHWPMVSTCDRVSNTTIQMQLRRGIRKYLAVDYHPVERHYKYPPAESQEHHSLPQSSGGYHDMLFNLTLVYSVLLAVMTITSAHGTPVGRKGLKQFKMRRPEAPYRGENADSL